MKRLMLVIPLILIVALAVMGVGYGLWYENLTVDGAVSTGTVSGQFINKINGSTAYHCWDNEESDNTSPWPWKDVGNTSIHLDTNDPTIMHVTVDNGYPYYAGICDVKYQSTGTVPVHVESFTFVPNTSSTASNVGTLHNCTQGAPVFGSGGATVTMTCDELEMSITDGLGSQLHQLDWKSANLNFLIKQPAQQNTQYNFDLVIQLNQYNESMWPIPPSTSP